MRKIGVKECDKTAAFVLKGGVRKRLPLSGELVSASEPEG